MVIKHRRNFLPTFIVNLFFWSCWFYLVFNVSPDFNFPLRVINFSLTFPAGLFLFFLTLISATTLTFAFLLSHTRRGLFLSLFINGVLFLRLIKQSQLLNLALLIGILTCLEIYFNKKAENPY